MVGSAVPAPALPRDQPTDRETPWWRDAVIYQIYPRSFADANGDGVGDLRGIIDHLDYLGHLGIDGVWLSPIFSSPMADFGYDVADYLSVDPIFGTNDDLDELISGLHERGLRLLLDWVPNHTSVEHEWFRESRSSRSNPRRDWYVWRDGPADGSPPTNWQAAFAEEPAWTHDPTTDQWYLHLFLPQQPDLNWANPEVEAAMHQTLRYWLDRGVDGFRADVVHLIGKGADVADLPGDQAKIPVISIDRPFGHELLQRIRSLLDSYQQQPMMVGEVYLLEPGQSVSYLGEDGRGELHLSFDFRPLHTRWDAAALHEAIASVQNDFAEPHWPTWVLSNHDSRRHRTRHGTEARARAAAVLSLTVRGTPFLYAGEELGLEDAVIPPDRVVDPGGRDGCRAPIPWTSKGDDRSGHGWLAEPWLPFPANAASHAADRQVGVEGSIHSLYQRLLRLRRERPALRRGSMELAPPTDGVLRFDRTYDEDTITVLVNMTPAPVSWPRDLLSAGVVVSSSPDRTRSSDELAPDEAVVIDSFR